MAASILVIGIGNEYRSDDGIGPAIVRALQAKKLPGVQCREDPGDTLSLIEQWDTADMVILIDAVSSRAEPGTIYRFDALAQSLPINVPLSSTHSLQALVCSAQVHFNFTGATACSNATAEPSRP